METIEDIRGEEVNPRATGVDGIPGGRPVPLNRAFGEESVPWAGALVALVLGLLSGAAGAVTFIVWFWVAALILLIAALVLFLRARHNHLPA